MKYFFYLKHLSILGVFGLIFNIDLLKYFLVLIIIYVIELIYKYQKRKREIPYYHQVILQKIGNKYLKLRYKERSISSKNEYSFPFDEKWYVEFGGLNPNTSHSWFLLSQRYAYDFDQRDTKMNIYDGNIHNLKSYYCYEKNILAPAEGIVYKVCNKFDDSEILLHHQINGNVKELRGNYIIIKHSNNEYSLLAHLLKDSILVKEKDYVKMYDIVAKCGNSGHSNAPHLHFQVSDKPSFYFGLSLVINFKGYGQIENDITVCNK